MAPAAPPKAFISYAWEDEPHPTRVKDLATRLRTKDGIDGVPAKTIRLEHWQPEISRRYLRKVAPRLGGAPDTELDALSLPGCVRIPVVGRAEAHAAGNVGRRALTNGLSAALRCRAKETADNAARLIDAIRDFGFPTEALSIDGLATQGQVVIMGRPPNRIDVLTRPAGLDWAAAWERRVLTEYEGVPVGILSMSDLISAKRAAGRPRDLADLGRTQMSASLVARGGA